MADQSCRICRNFFGSMDGMCSMCYKQEQRKKQASEAVSQIATVIPSTLEETKEPQPVVQVQTDRCWSCKRKTGPMSFKCKCQFYFCSRHRLPEEHSCSFDHRSAGVRKLSEENPLVVAEKFTKL